MIPKNRFIRLLILTLLVGLDWSAFAFTAKDANTVFGSFNSAFYYQNGTNGWFKDTETGGIAYFWGQAEMIECVIDAYEWNSNSVYQAQITNLLNGFIKNNGKSWTSYTPYNDDVMWAVLAFARGGVATGRTNYFALAKANFDACYARAYDTNLGGGLYWLYPNNASKNACVNGPAAIAAYLLYQIYGDTNYLNKATDIYNWERATLFDTSSGVVADNIGTNGSVNGGATTYNQGTFLGAAHFLGYTNDARLAANRVMMSMTTVGILPQYGIANNDSGFNAIFLRWLTRFMKDRKMQNLYEPWLQANATAAWNVRRTNDNLSWCQWRQPSPAGTNFYAWDCISSYEILQAADATQGSSSFTVPGNFIGHYPLDATNGTIAVDSTGGGNNGTLSNAAWNASGRFNGCLTFNGTGAAQISNVVWNDFSIAFWLKTTQTGGSPQWYNGGGLVDGDAPSTGNDFGTALVGGKFAFGVGNPDTTILSAATINNGAWHHCVATRQLATGNLAVYVDGVLSGSGAGNRNTLNASAKLLFGAIASGGGYFNGSLDDIKIFDRTLTSNEVAALYFNSVVPPTDAPTNLTAVAGNAQIALDWSSAALATSYNIKRSLVSGGPYVTLTNVNTTTFIDTSVSSNRWYYYVVSGVNTVGEGTNSSESGASSIALAAWFKADAITNLSSGSALAVWTDSSGNGFNAVQALVANQPAVVSGVINGLPVVRFNAASSSYLWFLRPVQDDFTLIFVFQSSQGLGGGTDFWSGAGLVNGEVSGAVSDFGTSLNANGQILAGTGNPDATIRSSAGFNNGVPHVVTFKRTKSSGALALYVDGALVATGTGGTQSLTAPNKLLLGAQQVLNNYLTGDIAEVQIYNSPLSDADRQGYEKALKCKYGLAGGGTPAAPTGLTLTTGNRRISLNWTMAAGATSYNIWRYNSATNQYVMIASAVTGSSFVDTNAANGLINYYKITGSDACGDGSYSTVSSVLLPLPTLTLISANENGLTLNWPGLATDWKLYAATNLATPVLWWPVTNTVGSSNNIFNVTVPMNLNNQFFRLASP